jgi:hypothetical protein
MPFSLMFMIVWWPANADGAPSPAIVPVIGITKVRETIIKEWLFQLLNEDFNIVRSPKVIIPKLVCH